jgi:predicted nucleic acid-binding protein
MGQGYLVDTNTIIDYLENKLPEKSNKLIDNIIIQFSVISRIELLVWKKATEDQVKILNEFISSSTVFDLNEGIILKSIEIRKNYRLKLPDTIVAATAMVYNLPLITRNTSDFEKVIQIKCIDPYHL